eukprot:CAMPEP_0198110116 /NCGR_PEP_ID=MMETSP1442-20131203/2155_1 /TAXON_ID= /ORGANISM="Craspedostauros australis, Strain CCMP3328" /LENGTH=43 /DNA_ID= /DNA_START= /DNA_END= /DNA_ORIENTATION=
MGIEQKERKNTQHNAGRHNAVQYSTTQVNLRRRQLLRHGQIDH